MKNIAIALLIGLCLISPKLSFAGDTNARDYIPAPAGVNLALTYYKHITADSMYANGNRNTGFNFTQDIEFFRFVHFDTLFGMPVNYQALGFFTSQSLNVPGAPDTHLSSSGVMDPALVSTIWPVSNPATKTWVGFTQYVTVPIGEYSKNNALNSGGNVWVFKEELGLAQGIGDKVVFELQPSLEFYTDNSDNTAGKLAKNPLFQINSHLSYEVTPKFFVAADYTYQNGGSTKTAGAVNADTYQNSHRLGGSFNYKLAADIQLMLEYSKTVDTKNGANAAISGARFLYIF